MPLLNVKVIENVFTDEQKKQMVERLTDAMFSPSIETMASVSRSTICGNALTTEDVQALAAGVAVG